MYLNKIHADWLSTPEYCSEEWHLLLTMIHLQSLLSSLKCRLRGNVGMSIPRAPSGCQSYQWAFLPTFLIDFMGYNIQDHGLSLLHSEACSP